MPPEPQLREMLFVFLQTEAFPCNWAKKVGSLNADCDRAGGGDGGYEIQPFVGGLSPLKPFPGSRQRLAHTLSLSLSCSSSFSFLVMELEASHLLSAGLHPVLSQAAWLKDFGREAAASFLNIRNSPACQGRGVQAWFGIRCLLPWRVVLKQHAGVSARHCNTACPCNRGDIIALHHCGKPVQDTPQSSPSLWYRRERRKAFVACSLNQLPPSKSLLESH